MSQVKFEMMRTGAEYYFRCVAGNGKTLAHSETYQRKGDAEDAILMIVGTASGAEIIDKTQSSTKVDDELVGLVKAPGAVRKK